MIELRTCGVIALTDDAGHPMTSVLAQPKRLGLLVYLALEGEHGGCSRDRRWRCSGLIPTKSVPGRRCGSR